MSQLVTPITLNDVTIRDRVWVAPTCRSSAVDGLPNDCLGHCGHVHPEDLGRLPIHSLMSR